MASSTGHKCDRSGLYRSTCACRLEIALSRGDTFPPCGRHGAVGWVLFQPTHN
jgi:hypothetical protein